MLAISSQATAYPVVDYYVSSHRLDGKILVSASIAVVFTGVSSSALLSLYKSGRVVVLFGVSSRGCLRCRWRRRRLVIVIIVGGLLSESSPLSNTGRVVVGGGVLSRGCLRRFYRWQRLVVVVFGGVLSSSVIDKRS